MKAIEQPFSRALEHRLGRHLLFWVTVYLIFTVARTSLESYPYETSTILLMNLHGLIPSILAAYSLNYYLIPRFFNQKQVITFLLLFAISAYVICVMARIITVYVNEPLFRLGDYNQESIPEILTQIGHLISVYFPAIYFVAFAMAVLKQQKIELEIRQRNVLLEKEKTQTELNFLKAQIHPHFLFNTLNNLYLLCLKKSDKAPETVVKLSEILDYMLYKGNQEVVTVAQEIKLLENYIALEKLRYGDGIKMTFFKEIDDDKLGISPLLLLSMVENAFKHGASGSLEDPVINIALQIKDQQLVFQVYNTKSPYVQKDLTNHKKGIGVSNIRRQLALLYKNHEFLIEEGEQDYGVTLKINLSPQNRIFKKTAARQQLEKAQASTHFPEEVVGI